MENINSDLNQDDQVFNRKYSKLRPDYLENVSKHANLDDVINGLVNIEDADCITNYSGGVSDVVHYGLKNKTIEGTILVKDFEARLFEALKRLPSYNNQLVFRMEIHSPSIPDYQKYFGDKIGKVMSICFYLSTSKEEWEGETVIYKIKTLPSNSNAKDISRVTNSAWEKEVLFLKNTNFLIQSQELNNSKLSISMEETLQTPDFDYNYVLIGFDENSITKDDELGLFD